MNIPYARRATDALRGETCTTREAAKALGVALRTAQLWAETGRLRAWKTVGGHRRILVSSIHELLKERGREVTALGGGHQDAGLQRALSHLPEAFPRATVEMQKADNEEFVLLLRIRRNADKAEHTTSVKVPTSDD